MMNLVVADRVPGRLEHDGAARPKVDLAVVVNPAVLDKVAGDLGLGRLLDLRLADPHAPAPS